MSQVTSQRIGFEYSFPAGLDASVRDAAVNELERLVDELAPERAIRREWARLAIQHVDPQAPPDSRGELRQQLEQLGAELGQQKGFRYEQTPLGVVCIECFDIGGGDGDGDASFQVTTPDGETVRLLIGYRVIARSLELRVPANGVRSTRRQG